MLKRLYNVVRPQTGRKDQPQRREGPDRPGLRDAIMETRYCKEAPSNQTAVDILKGYWLSAFPDEANVKAGHIRHFDPNVEFRVQWAAGVLENGVRGMDILELGPFEAYQTYLLEKEGANSVTSIEAADLSYLKCLIVKETLGLRAHFLHGDFIPFLEQTDERYDMIWASGVLYHQTEPLKLLSLIADATDTAFVHTHYYDKDAIRQNSNVASRFIPEKDRLVEFDGYQARLHYRSYRDELSGPIFAGGSEPHSFWMEQEDIFGSLRRFGFQRFDMGRDDKNNPNGPGMFFLAKK